MARFRWSCGPAPTSQAKCKGCGEKITKGELRIGVRIEVENAEDVDSKQLHILEAPKWFHTGIDCIGKFRKTTAWWVEHTPEELEGTPEENQEEIAELLDNLKAAVHIPKKAAPKKAAPKKRAPKATPKRPTKKRKIESESDD